MNGKRDDRLQHTSDSDLSESDEEEEEEEDKASQDEEKSMCSQFTRKSIHHYQKRKF